MQAWFETINDQRYKLYSKISSIISKTAQRSLQNIKGENFWNWPCCRSACQAKWVLNGIGQNGDEKRIGDFSTWLLFSISMLAYLSHKLVQLKEDYRRKRKEKKREKLIFLPLLCSQILKTWHPLRLRLRAESTADPSFLLPDS